MAEGRLFEFLRAPVVEILSADLTSAICMICIKIWDELRPDWLMDLERDS